MFFDPHFATRHFETKSRASVPITRRPWAQLTRAILLLAGEHGELLRHSESPWASVTFSGTRHTLAVLFNGAAGMVAGECFIDALPDHEFVISRQLVVDAQITLVTQDNIPQPQMMVEVELLLLEDYK
ncbi:MAG: hypothetical protein RLY97_1217 [Pseudomonadota bacterium]